jgi:membrane associated rhomboid family serine protease
LLFLVLGAGSGKSDKSINHAAHAGGLIAGIFIGMFLAQFSETQSGPYEKKIKTFGLIGYALLFVGSFLINYLRSK